MNWYAITNCKQPNGIFQEFWKWDCEYDVCYVLGTYDELVPYADKCRTLAGAEDRARDVLSTIVDDEVYIILVHETENHDMDFTKFIKTEARV